ncbi:MAG: NADH-quinone oxidoreductase subunit G, partial [Burkholderiaceae bacterium]|nr:NADH-quinone oxidoreductase subunit G [Burkholderiaceae bacterium]
IVRTKSDKAIAAQKSVMEFLLINHPLDCPICDQGGECQLQDLAVGYGHSASRYTEEKRVVFHKDVGPLISMEEMTRCIHCTRCIRFGQEIGGVMELGMINRGEHSEITTIAGDTIDSELSGNMIDICPVGALTSKPFRFTARTWELSRRKSVSPHDSTGSNLVVQVKSNRVMRVVPLENEAVNECWIADRDRYSYEALNSDDRLTAPMIKENGAWKAVDWQAALDYVARGLQQVVHTRGAQAVGALVSPQRTLEEMHLLARLVRGLGSDNIDHRLRHADFSNAAAEGSARWLGMPIAALSTLERVLVIGSFLRKDHPLFAQRIRQATRHGAKVYSVHALADDWLLPVAGRITAAPGDWPRALADICAAVAKAKGVGAPVPGDATAQAQAIADGLLSGERKAILLGNAAAQHPQASALLALANWLGEQTGAHVGYLGDAGNGVGAQLAGALPRAGGLDAGRMLGAQGGLQAMLLFDVEPALDAADARAAAAAVAGAGLVVAFTSFRSAAAGIANVMLPIAPFTETSGTFVNAEGRVQGILGVVKPLGETRPGWKVLRVLGNLLEIDGFDYETSEEVRAAVLGDGDIAARLDNRAAPIAAAAGQTGDRLERIADVPIYAGDPLVRRSPPLQATRDALAPVVGVPSALWEQLGLQRGDRVRVSQGDASAELPAQLDPTLAQNALRVAAGHPDTAGLGAMFGTIRIEKARA